MRTDFVDRTGSYRRELLAHCYRMLGSIHDAEDLVQETYLRAWRSYDAYDPGRASLRTWLYRIATNACLTALDQRSRRALPSALGSPGSDPEGHLSADLPEVTWLEPWPDIATSDPAAITESRESLRLALVAALQYLPARQRGILLLRDVLGWPASEVSELTGLSVPAVHSAVRRARAQLERVMPTDDGPPALSDTEQQQLLNRYARAFETADIETLLRLLTVDATWEMPPVPDWFSGREAIGRLIVAQCGAMNGGGRMVRTSANGQPAFALYVNGRAYSLQVLTLTGAGIAKANDFHDLRVFAPFGLPLELAGR
ncbi:RNA polymerase, sigma-24 subunit, ECF subfamily [Kribbella flavida DSM 17836]|uniref:RNA polymerase sigma factor n=1 Tax=Kribbella flavida (strain DSM 17836 / JCM 10339 / NBRC 14399) TaxID=479435 RepID=D2Q4Z7_KRIFD|nr:sigma-70 family RNA polymerase sigma factor [Kribbella flavida]ADB34252.1 RNA polymerase, sigma-24 subunit, ECF subfamily [Kribbella flavida DSM 17836]